MKHLYQVFGISKQAYHKRLKAGEKRTQNKQSVLKMIQKVRKTHPRAGGKKLYNYLKPELEKENIKMGRDALFDLLRDNGLLVKKTKRFHITTNSKHHFYKSPNLLKGTKLVHSEQAVVSDITYIKTDQGHAYMAIVTDPYSKKVMGYALEDNMQVSMVKKALKMAYKNLKFKPKNILHHSDRGLQYCCPDYTGFAEKLGFTMSTTQQYDPYENAVAERINQTLKYEYGLKRKLPNLKTAQKMAQQAVEIYNTKRTHWSLNLKTPQKVHNQYNKQTYKSYAKPCKNRP